MFLPWSIFGRSHNPTRQGKDAVRAAKKQRKADMRVEELEERAVPANYFVDATNATPGTGTIADPFRTIQQAINQANSTGANDVIFVFGNNSANPAHSYVWRRDGDADGNGILDGDMVLKSQDVASGRIEMRFLRQDRNGNAANLIVKMEDNIVDVGTNATLRIGDGTVGDTTNRVIFTSYFDDAAGGDTNNDGNVNSPQRADWGGIRFRAGAIDQGVTDTVGAIVNWADIRYTGASLFDVVAGAATEFGSIRMEATVSGDTVTAAAQVRVWNTTFRHGGRAIDVNVNALGGVVARGPDIGYNAAGIGGLGPQQNTYQNNSINGIFVFIPEDPFTGIVQPLLVNTQLDDVGNPYVFTQRLILGTRTQTPGGGTTGAITLTVDPGIVLKFQNTSLDGVDLRDPQDRVFSTININGTADMPVLITSLTDDNISYNGNGVFPNSQLASFYQNGTQDTNNDGNASTPQPGDWGGIRIGEGNIDHAVIRFAGGFVPVEGTFVSHPAITVFSRDLTPAPIGGDVQHVRVSNSDISRTLTTNDPFGNNADSPAIDLFSNNYGAANITHTGLVQIIDNYIHNNQGKSIQAHPLYFDAQINALGGYGVHFRRNIIENNGHSNGVYVNFTPQRNLNPEGGYFDDTDINIIFDGEALITNPDQAFQFMSRRGVEPSILNGYLDRFADETTFRNALQLRLPGINPIQLERGPSASNGALIDSGLYYNLIDFTQDSRGNLLAGTAQSTPGFIRQEFWRDWGVNITTPGGDPYFPLITRGYGLGGDDDPANALGATPNFLATTDANGNGTMTLTFPNAVSAFGFYIVDNESTSPNERIELIGADGTLLETIAMPVGDRVFVGRISRQPIHQIRIFEDADDNVGTQFVGGSVAIPDNGTATSTITVLNSFTVTDVDVLVNISHPRVSDLELTLVGPGGQQVLLANRPGGAGAAGANMTGTYFDQQAPVSISAGFAPFTGVFRPTGDLNVFNGTNANGVWTLRVRDLQTGQTGSVANWQLNLKSASVTRDAIGIDDLYFVEAGESLVVKAFDAATVITAAGATDGQGTYFNDGFATTITNIGPGNAIASGNGGTLRIMGQGRYPAHFTSLDDDSVGAGIIGRKQNDAGANGNSIGEAGQWQGIRIAQGVNSSEVEIIIQNQSGTLVRRYADLNPYTLGDEGATYLPGFDSYKDIYYQGLAALQRSALNAAYPVAQGGSFTQGPVNAPVFLAYSQDGTLVENAAISYAVIGVEQRGYPEHKLTIESNEVESNPGNPAEPLQTSGFLQPMGPTRHRADNAVVFDTSSGAWRVGARIGGTNESPLTGTDDIDWFEIPDLPEDVQVSSIYINAERGTAAADGLGSSMGIAVFNEGMQLLYISAPWLPIAATMGVTAAQIANSGGALGRITIQDNIGQELPHQLTNPQYDAKYVAVFGPNRLPRTFVSVNATPAGLLADNQFVQLVALGPGDGSNGFRVVQHVNAPPGQAPTPIDIPGGDSFWDPPGPSGAFLGGYEVEFKFVGAADRTQDPIRNAEGQIVIRNNLIANNLLHGILLQDVEIAPGTNGNSDSGRTNTVLGPTIPNYSARFANSNLVTNNNGNPYTNPNYFVVGPDVYNNLIIENGGDGIRQTESLVLNPTGQTPEPTTVPNPPRPTAFTQIFNNTIDRNEGIGINLFSRGGPNVVNNIVSNNNVGIAAIDYGDIGGGHSAVVSYNMLFLNGTEFAPGSTFNGTQNLVGQNPFYVDDTNRDYRLLIGSAGVDSALSNISDRLASARFPNEQSRAPLADFRNASRIDNPTKPNVGAGQFPFYDRGAFESNEPSLRVVALSVYTTNNVLGEPVSQIVVTFSGRVDPSTVNSNTVFIRRGSTTGPIVPIGLPVGTYDPVSDLHTFVIPTQSPLQDDVFCLTLRGITDVGNPNGIRNIAGQLLDGEFDGNFPSGNGQAGGNFLYCFAVRTTVIQGLVWNNADGDLVQDPGEPGLANIRLDVTWAGFDGLFGTGDDQAFPQAVTNSQGRYTLSGLPAGSFRIDVDDSSLPANFKLNTPPDPKFVNLGIGETSADISFGYWLDLSNARIGDTVWNDANGDGIRNAGEQGIANALVTLQGAGSDATFGTGDDLNLTTITDGNGAYAFASLPAGPYRVNVDTSSLAPGFGRTFPASVPYDITLNPGQQNNAIDFGFQQKNSTISGKVFDDVNFNGVDEAEPGLSGVTVQLIWAGFNNIFGDADDTTTVASTMAGGAYSFGNLGSGQYRIFIDESQAALTNYFRTTTNNPINVTLTSGNQTVSNQLFGYSLDPANGMISGVAFEDLNNNSVRDGEPGIANLLVTLVWAGQDGIFGNGDDTTVSQNATGAGAYSFTGLRIGNYRVSTATPAPGNWANTTPNPVTLSRTKNQPASTVDFGWIRKESAINGTVFQDFNGDGILNGSDAPFSQSFRVYIDRNSNDSFDTGEESAFTTPFTGAYSIANLEAGTHRVRIDVNTIPVGYGRTPAFRDVTVGTGATVNGVDLGLQARNGKVQGTLFSDPNLNGIQNAGELGLGGVGVTLVWYGSDGFFGTADDETFNTTTNINGQYTFNSLAGQPTGNNYRVSVNTASLPPGTVPTVPNPPQVDFNLQVSGTVERNFGFLLPPGSEPALFYFTVDHAGTLTNSDGSSLQVFDTDIIKLTVGIDGSYGYNVYFRGSDVGLTPGTDEAIDAFTFLRDGSILISFKGQAAFYRNWFLPGKGSGVIMSGIFGEDLMRFIPSQVNGPTAGTWRWYVDGSDVLLSGNQENVDAVAVRYNAAGNVSNILLSTKGNVLAKGQSGTNADILDFRPTALGATTNGTYSLFFKGGNVGLNDNTNENIDGLFVPDEVGNPLPSLYFSTVGGFAVPGLAGESRDIFQFNPTGLGQSTAGSFNNTLSLDGSARGLNGFNINDFWVGAAPGDDFTLPAAAPAGFATLADTSAGSNADLLSLLSTDGGFTSGTQKKQNTANRLSNAAVAGGVQSRKAVENFFLNAQRTGVKQNPDDPAKVAAALAGNLAELLG